MPAGHSKLLTTRHDIEAYGEAQRRILELLRSRLEGFDGSDPRAAIIAWRDPEKANWRPKNHVFGVEGISYRKFVTVTL